MTKEGHTPRQDQHVLVLSLVACFCLRAAKPSAEQHLVDGDGVAEARLERVEVLSELGAHGGPAVQHAGNVPLVLAHEHAALLLLFRGASSSSSSSSSAPRQVKLPLLL